jgi:exonuclease VII small subunit
MPVETPTVGRYETIVAMLAKILERLETLEHDLDDIDRALKPYGDGTKDRRPRR